MVKRHIYITITILLYTWYKRQVIKCMICQMYPNKSIISDQVHNQTLSVVLFNHSTRPPLAIPRLQFESNNIWLFTMKVTHGGTPLLPGPPILDSLGFLSVKTHVIFDTGVLQKYQYNATIWKIYYSTNCYYILGTLLSLYSFIHTYLWYISCSFKLLSKER